MPKKFDSPQERRTYQTWADMRSRCNNRRHARYDDYGGRGIKVCKRWDSFDNFVADMGLKPEDGERMCIGRKNVDGDYSPSNCEWVTYSQNNKNQQRTLRIKYKGKSQSVEEWAKEYDMPRTTLSNRIHIYKWPIGVALEAPLQHKENIPDDPEKAKFVPKLNAEMAREIRLLYAEGRYSYREIGEWFGVSGKTIGDIVNNETWVEE